MTDQSFELAQNNSPGPVVLRRVSRPDLARRSAGLRAQ